MRILIDPGSHHLLNLGDVAMLQVCVRRLRELWPGARIDVLTENPELLERLCPGVEPVPSRGRIAWLRQPDATATPTPERRLARVPRLARAALRVERRRRGAASPELRAYLDSLLAADLFVMSGRGGLTDAFADEAVAMLEELRMARAAGAATAMLGQGIGPLDPALRRRAARALPGVGLIALRERRTGPRLLAELGVDAGRIRVTGDDAIELALEAASAAAPAAGGGRTGARATSGAALHGAGVGASVRVADYAGVGEGELAAVRAAVGAAARLLGAELEPVALSSHPHEPDADAFGGDPPATPDDAIARIRRCRVMVAGSYHAAVFALAQGIPAVCLAGTPYYRDKFLGLQTEFGPACEVLELQDDDLADRLEAAVERGWERAPDARGELLAAARRQVEAGRAAYAELRNLIR